MRDSKSDRTDLQARDDKCAFPGKQNSTARIPSAKVPRRFLLGISAVRATQVSPVRKGGEMKTKKDPERRRCETLLLIPNPKSAIFNRGDGESGEIFQGAEELGCGV